MHPDDLIGRTYGRLTVLRYLAGTNPNRSTFGKYHRPNLRYWCRCACGRELDIQGGALVSGRQHSCGCASPRGAEGYQRARETFTRRLAEQIDAFDTARDLREAE